MTFTSISASLLSPYANRDLFRLSRTAGCSGCGFGD